MAAFVVRRLLLAFITLSLVSLIAFGLVNLMPGNVIEARLADAPNAREELLPKLRKELGLDKPKHEQFIDWYSSALQGDLGKSLFSGETVVNALKRTFPTTVEIALVATVLAIIVSVLFGSLAAVYQDRPLDHVTRLITIGALAVPDFWLATLFIVFSSDWLGYTLPLTFSKLTEDFGDNAQTIGIAALIIGLRSSGVLTRLVRSSMLEVLRQDYMRTARAKGMRERSVIMVHGLRNAALPVLTLLGLQFAALLGGTVVIETVFSIPGTGQLVTGAIRTRDFTLIQGVVLLFGFCLVMVNLLVDLLYGVVDPRIRVSG